MPNSVVNFPFIAGLVFAAIEQSSSAVSRHLEEFHCEEFVDGVVFELPKFFAFGFLAGVAADWILDTTQNHAAQIVTAVAICMLVLCLSSSLRRNGLHLKALFQRDDLQAWRVNAILVGTMAYLLAAFPYLVFSSKLGLSTSAVLSGVGFTGTLYFTMLVVRFRQICHWQSDKAARIAQRTLQAYCKFLPDTVSRVSLKPQAHAALTRFEFEQKRIIVEKEYKVSLQCCCLESYLVEEIGDDCFLPHAQILSIVRDHIGKIAREVMIERAALHVLIGDAQERISAADLLRRNAAPDLLKQLDELRRALSQ